ncbi:monofunctional biosynthetic peptidoglycan transglycosylase [Propionivibrio dicarboxylicus]|uniref:Biosynthetic peptidoglycan transglycosylase n=1 Tax=Propionivibrio dicarboxylicus TaxID=83767 RepID=A0A1G7X0P7_9RHOO|nr:monofunctional biosynthetic peptidoglycan transglycosylase [Propionivibrio dicarboxylicus]SDG77717.1 monofunctional biosynthetic peptidoglycan transglycosylase [Propionivibrio dicarboxylicus]
MKAARFFASLGRWTKRLLWLVVIAAVLYEAWIFAWVLWWRDHNPDITRFMEIRLAELQQKTPGARLSKHWVEYGAITPALKRALIVAEDDSFVHHQGFDWRGMQKALERNEQRGKIAAGGSTITQQLAKNLFLTPDKTHWRKAQEAVITAMIEATWSKRRILEVYLNVIEWGNGVFGAEAAALHHFGIAAAQLSPEQAARLAAMVPSPRYYDRHRDSAGLAAQTDVLLGRLPAAQIP